MCMSEPRSVRFSCGHASCCRDCAAHILRRRDRCPICRTTANAVAASGGQIALENTFVAVS